MDTTQTRPRPPLTAVRLLVEHRGIKHRWLARRLGVSPPQLVRLLAGSRDYRVHLPVIADALGVPVSLIEPAEDKLDA